MSWDAYISNLEVGGCKYAAIIGLDGSFWAGNFSPTPEEIRALVGLATKGGDTSNGVRLGGWDYTVVSMDTNENIKLKRKNCSPNEKYFVYCGVTKKAVVIGAVPTGANERNCCVVMSWDPYLQQLQSLGVEIGGLYGKNGALWASHPEFQCTPNEILILAEAMSGSNDNIYNTGVILSGQKWTVIRREDDVSVIVLKGKEPSNCKRNLIIAMSGMALVCGANINEDVSAGVIRNGVERVRDYLKSVNY